MKSGRRRSWMCGDRVNTAVLGVERAPMPSRVSRVRNMETPSWSGALMRVGKPIVRGAELLGGTGCPRSECRWPKGDRKTRLCDRLLRWSSRITGRIPGLVLGCVSRLT
jgi:hypothetical protein